MRFSILGPLLVYDTSERPINVGGVRLRVLLTVLLLRPGQRITTAELTDAIWAQGPPVSAHNALQALVSRLRRTLGEEARIEGEASGYRLVVDPRQVDLGEFEFLAKQGRAQLTAGQCGEAERTLGRALALWRGPALVDLTAHGIAEDTALRLAEMHGAVLEDRLAAQIGLGEHTAALPEAEALASREPHRERPVELLVRALAGAGRTAEATAAYDRFRGHLADELGLDPSPQLQDVHVRLLRGELSQAAHQHNVRSPEGDGGAAPPPPQVRLPSALTSFVARQNEVDTAVSMLTDGRLSTLSGPGGAGKTRLAVEAATALADRAPGMLAHGGWFVELAPLTSDEGVPDAVVNALGLREHTMLQARSASPASSAMERITAFLSDRPALLVLDNCEHVVDGVAHLVESLLARCPALRVLVTSREPLCVPGEQLLTVPPLELPPEGVDAARAAAFASVALFTERASAVRPDFDVTSGNVAHVVHIVRELDGMPLALELAAARLRSMSPAQLSDRLTDRFRLLTGGSRSALPRHRTLRAVVDWSWELLDEPERRLLRRLSVFPGGATLEAVELVGADPPGGREPGGPETAGTVAGQDVWTVLFALVDKSLVAPEYCPSSPSSRGDPSPRYRQLATVRAYAAERLSESGEEDRVRATHARYVRDVWREADPKLRGPEQSTWFSWLDGQTDDFSAALRWAVDRRDAHLALDLIEYVQWYCFLGDVGQQIGRWSREVLDMLGDRVPRGRAIGYACCLFHAAIDPLAHHDNVMAQIVRIEEILQEQGEHGEEHPVLLHALTYSVLTEGSEGHLGDRIERAAAHPDRWTRAMVLLMLCQVDVTTGLADRAKRRAIDAVELFRGCGDVWGECHALAQVVDLVRFTDLAECRRLLDEATALAERNDLDKVAWVLRVRRAQILADLGELDTARHDLRIVRENLPLQYGIQVLLNLIEAQVLREQGDLQGARERTDRIGPALAELGGFAPIYLEPATWVMAASVSRASGETDRAWREAIHAWGLVGRGLNSVTAELLDFLTALFADSDPRRAVTLLGYAEGLRGTVDAATPLVVDTRDRVRRALGDPEYERLLAVALSTPADRIHDQVGEWLAARLKTLGE